MEENKDFLESKLKGKRKSKFLIVSFLICFFIFWIIFVGIPTKIIKLNGRVIDINSGKPLKNVQVALACKYKVLKKNIRHVYYDVVETDGKGNFNTGYDFFLSNVMMKSIGIKLLFWQPSYGWVSKSLYFKDLAINPESFIIKLKKYKKNDKNYTKIIEFVKKEILEKPIIKISKNKKAKLSKLLLK